jgi:4-hydroxy 2-oxovalerate aldolase
VQYMLTGQQNQHPRTAIAFTADKREDYFTFYQSVLDRE